MPISSHILIMHHLPRMDVLKITKTGYTLFIEELQSLFFLKKRSVLTLDENSSGSLKSNTHFFLQQSYFDV